MAALYATSLMAASVLDTYGSTMSCDGHTDSESLVSGYYHMRARPSDRFLHKTELFKNTYRWVSVSKTHTHAPTHICKIICTCTHTHTL
jgi:hypothetical protein